MKKIAYDFDLVSGKVNQVSYQPGQPDAFYHLSGKNNPWNTDNYIQLNNESNAGDSTRLGW